MKQKFTTRQIAEYGILIALAILLSYLEYLLPFLPAIPGVKLGLTNIVVVFTLYSHGNLPAIIISLVRVLLMSVLFGNGFAFLYSLAGAALSLLVMLLLKWTDRFSPVGVAAAGGISHNMGQLLCAMVLLKTRELAFYLPVLLLSGLVAGALVGAVAQVLIRRLGAICK